MSEYYLPLWANSADKLKIIFLIFSRKQVLTFHTNCPMETICMKCLNRFSGKQINKEKFKMSSAEFFLLRVLNHNVKSIYSTVYICVNHLFYFFFFLQDAARMYINYILCAFICVC